MKWQPSEALRYMVEGFHDKEFWADSNRTHARAFSECTDEMCAAARGVLDDIMPETLVKTLGKYGEVWE
jgi:hypothetical protein